MDVETDSGPRLDPGETQVGKEEVGIEKITLNPIAVDVASHLP